MELENSRTKESTRAHHHCIQTPHGPAGGHRHRRELPADHGGRHRETGQQEVALSRVPLHHQGPLRHPPGLLVVAPPGSRSVAPRGARRPSPDRLSDPRRTHRGGPLRPQWLALHPGLRGPGRVVGDHHGQDRTTSPDAHRLGHHRADHRASDGDRPRPRAPRQALCHRRGRSELAQGSLLRHVGVEPRD